MQILQILRSTKIHKYLHRHFKHLRKNILCQNYAVIMKFTCTVQCHRLQYLSVCLRQTVRLGC